jgi:hypothetical protein
VVAIETVVEVQTEKEAMVVVHQIENLMVETLTELKEIALLKEVVTVLKEAQVVKENRVMQEEFLLTQNQNLKRKVGKINYKLIQKSFKKLELFFYT